MDHVFDIVVDAQNDFMRPDGKLYVPNADTIIAALQQYIGSLDGQGVLFTFDTHIAGVYEKSEEAKQFPIHCVKPTEGWQLAIDRSVVKVPMFTLEKGVFNMWQQPAFVHGHNIIIDREEFFEDLLAHGITTLRFSGVAADYCVKWGIEGGLDHGFEVQVIASLTMGIERDMHRVVQDDFAGRVTVV